MLTTTLRLAKARTREDLRFAKQRGLRELKQLLNPIGADKLRRALDQLVSGAGGSPILLVHSALSDCGRFTAGPSGVLDVIGEYCTTLCLPTFSYCYPGAPDETGPLFDRHATPSLMGLLTETFRGRDGVTRSIHATHSLAVTGPEADALTRDHYRLDAPCGAGSPFARLLERNASVLMFGVTFMHYTLCHTAEDAAGSCYAYQGGTIDRLRVVDEAGRPHEYRSRRQARTPRRFEEAGEAVIRKGLAREIALGKGKLRYVPDCVKVHDYLVERLRRHPDFLQRDCAQSLD